MTAPPKLSLDQEGIIVAWALDHSDHVRAVLLFGSRLTGIRREKEERKPIPDVALAVSLAIADHAQRQTFFTDVRDT